MSRRKSGQRPPDVLGDMVGDSRQKIAGKGEGTMLDGKVARIRGAFAWVVLECVQERKEDGH